MKAFLILTLYLSTNVIAQISSAQSQNSSKNDFQIFRKALTETHPALYRFTLKERFDVVFDSIESQLTDTSTDLQLFRGLSKVMSMVREGHSYVAPSEKLAQQTREKGLFPFEVIVNENRMVVRKSRSDSYFELVKTEITSINGLPVPAILDAIAASTGSKSAFNNAALESTLSEFSNFAFAYHYFVDTTSTFTVTYQLPAKQNEQQIKV